MRICIIGGGLAGLSLGYFLMEENINFRVLKNNEVGRLFKYISGDEFTFDVGKSHIISSKNKGKLQS